MDILYWSETIFFITLTLAIWLFVLGGLRVDLNRF